MLLRQRFLAAGEREERENIGKNLFLGGRENDVGGGIFKEGEG